jgi:hypothetical protein
MITSVIPRFVKWYATLAPIIPPPIITTWALLGIPFDIGENDRLDVPSKQFWLPFKAYFYYSIDPI